MEKFEAHNLILNEYDKAVRKFPKFNSAHEGYAVILEEMDELWHEIKNNKHAWAVENQKREAIQVATMALRFLTDCME